MKVRHVWLLPPLNVGDPEPGLVLAWRRTTRLASPPMWEAQVVYVDRSEVTRIEWIPESYLVPVESEPPGAGVRRGHPSDRRAR